MKTHNGKLNLLAIYGAELSEDGKKIIIPIKDHPLFTVSKTTRGTTNVYLDIEVTEIKENPFGTSHAIYSVVNKDNKKHFNLEKEDVKQLKRPIGGLKKDSSCQK